MATAVAGQRRCFRTRCPGCERDVAVGGFIRSTGERITACACRERVPDGACYKPEPNAPATRRA